MDYPVAIVSQLQQYLRSLRKSRGMTQTDLAKRLGVVQSRVADIEAHPGSVSVEQLLQILALLNAQLVVRDAQPVAAEIKASAGGARREKTAGTIADVPAPAAPRRKADPPTGQW